jgi:hypothetical protein
LVSFAIALAFRLEPLVANLPLAAADDVTTVVAVLEPLGEEINGIAKAPGYIDEMTARGAYTARKRTIADRDAPSTQCTSVVLDEGVLPTIKSRSFDDVVRRRATFSAFHFSKETPRYRGANEDFYG